MLSRVFEWYRIVNPQPVSDTIDKRKLAAVKLIATIDEQDVNDLLLGLADAVIAGFESRFDQDSATVRTVVSAIREHDSAFPEALSENAAELRVIAAIALGQLLVRNAGSAHDKIAVCLASVIHSGSHLRPLSKARFLKQLMEEVVDAARKVIAVSAGESRKSAATVGEAVEKLEANPTDAAAGIKSITSAFKKTTRELVRQAKIDREEINILWWMFSGISLTTGEAIADMPPGCAALTCGAELGDICLTPATQSVEAMVRKSLTSGRKGTLAERPLAKIATEWTNPLLKRFLADDSADVVQAHPVLFPLSWLATRLVSSDGAPGWEAEFDKKTLLQSFIGYDHSAIAVQVLREPPGAA